MFLILKSDIIGKLVPGCKIIHYPRNENLRNYVNLNSINRLDSLVMYNRLN